MDISAKLKQVNGRLKGARMQARVEQVGDRLVLRANLPPKPHSDRTTPYRQRIHTGLPANLDGLREAEKRAQLVSAQLATREFSWEAWGVTTEATVRSCGECIEAMKIDYTGSGGTLDTWNGDYMKVLKKLPAGALSPLICCKCW